MMNKKLKVMIHQTMKKNGMLKHGAYQLINMIKPTP
jgi:hypothetical protein